jgi:adenosylcobinamide-phosphate synthase
MIDFLTNANIININETAIFTLVILILAFLIDAIIGELPSKFHPVVFIGKTIDFFSKYLINSKNRVSGFFLTVFVVITNILLILIILFLASYNVCLFIIIASLIFSSTFSISMLLSSARSIKKDLEISIYRARKSIAYLVSRNTEELDENLIISATIETLSENITDSAISPIFYYILTSIFILLIFSLNNFSSDLNINMFYIITISILVAVFYRIINTLDAMVGYKNEKYHIIGYFPAKLDDILNYIPARLSGFFLVFTSFIYRNSGFDWKNSYYIMKKDAKNPPSPNSGFSMAAVAGSLNISLIKKGVYNIGENKKLLEKNDIIKAIKLSKLSIYMFILFLSFLIAIFIIF